MTFGEALEVIKAGGRVARPQEWCGGEHGVAIELRHLPDMRPMIVIRTGRGDYASWLPQVFDLLADDWEVVSGG